MRPISTVALTAAAGYIAISAPATAANSADRDGSAPIKVCGPLTSGKIDTSGEPHSMTVTPPAGMVITGYCVKAGSTKAGDGPVYTDLAKPVGKATFTHPSGKAISHYSVAWTPAPKPQAPPAKSQDPKLPPTYTPPKETGTAPAKPTGSIEPSDNTEPTGSIKAGQAKFPVTPDSTGGDNEAQTLITGGTAPSQVSHGVPSSRAQVLPNTGASADGLLAALGALLVGAGVWLTRRARA